MSKAIEDIKKIAFNIELNGIRCFGDEFRNIIKELERLEAIEESNPSEALECFKDIEERCKNDYENCIVAYDYEKELSTIKQYILKSQEQEKENVDNKKVLEIIKKKRVNVYTEIILCDDYEAYLNLDIIKETNDKWKLVEEEFDFLGRMVGAK